MKTTETETNMSDVDMKTKAKIRGRVKWCNEKKGYGFLTHSGEGDLFYHVNSVDWRI